MRTILQEEDGGIAMIVPDELLGQLGLVEGALLDVRLENGALTFSPVAAAPTRSATAQPSRG